METIDMAELGRVKGIGDVDRCSIGDRQPGEDGCCRIAKTKVLLSARRRHCGCAT